MTLLIFLGALSLSVLAFELTSALSGGPSTALSEQAWCGAIGFSESKRTLN